MDWLRKIRDRLLTAVLTTDTDWVDLTDGGTTTLHTHTSGTASAITVANEATDTSCFLTFTTAATGDLAPKSNSNLAFNSNTGALTLADITSTGNVLLNTSGKVLGYTSGAGTSVTQLTSKSTSVTIDAAAGRVITHNASLSSGATVGFSVNNSVYTNQDIVMLMITAGATPSDYNIWPVRNTSGVFNIYIKNIGAGSLSEAIEINFILIRGAIN